METTALLDEYIQAACFECGAPISNGGTYCLSCQGRHIEALGERADMLQQKQRDHMHEALSVIFLMATRPSIPMPKAIDRIAEVAQLALEKHEEEL